MTAQNTVRAKFRCVRNVHTGENPVQNVSEFTPVTSGSAENKSYWNATPTGRLELSGTRELNFREGQEYYIDIIPASQNLAG